MILDDPAALSSQSVRFTYTATAFGGQRRWFCCPSCGRQCRVLYTGNGFACRRCHGLKYECQYEGKYGKALRRIRRIEALRERIGWSGDLGAPIAPAKPKNMHWSTYFRIRESVQALQRELSHD